RTASPPTTFSKARGYLRKSIGCWAPGERSSHERMWRCIWLLAALSGMSFAQAPLHPTVPAAAQPSAHFDAQAATDAWLATLPDTLRKRSDSYFEGTYWLILWDYLAVVAVSLALLRMGLSARMRDLAGGLVRPAFLQTVLYFAQFLLISS